MNGSLAKRLAALEVRLPAPAPEGAEGEQAGDRLAEQLAKIAQRIHDEGWPLEDDPGQSPVHRCVVQAMIDAAEVGEWGTPKYGARFWRRVGRYAFVAHGVHHHRALYERTPSERLLEEIQQMREVCEVEEPSLWPPV